MSETFVRFKGSSFNRAERTVEAVIATPSPYRRHDSRGAYLEVLDTSAINPDNLVGLPVQDNHRMGSVRDTIGVVEAAWREGDNLAVRIRFTAAADVDPILSRIEDGTLKGVSIGYRVTRWAESGIGQARTKTAVAWTIHEVTLTANPADPAAQIRNSNHEEKQMLDHENPGDEPDIKQRRAEIRAMVRNAGLPPEKADTLIDADADDYAVKAAIYDALMSKPRRSTPPVIRSHAPAGADPDALLRNMTDALTYRMAGTDLPDAAKPFAQMTMKEMLRDCITRQGIDARGMSTDELIRTGMHTTGDFPVALQDAVHKVAMAGYQAATSQIKQLARKRTYKDFRPSHGAWIGDLGNLRELKEGGEITHTTFTEGGEVSQLSTYALAINYSRGLIVNDDLNLFGDTPAAFGRSAAQTEADLLVETLTGGGKLADGQGVFHSSRGNTRTGQLDIATLTATRLSLRTRKGRDGQSYINVTPRFLVVPPGLETTAEMLLTSINAATVGDVNPWSGKLKIIVEPRLPETHYYIFADPAVAPALQYGYLAGAEGVQVQRREMWDQLGISFRAWLDFGCGWVDWRGVERVEIA